MSVVNCKADSQMGILAEVIVRKQHFVTKLGARLAKCRSEVMACLPLRPVPHEMRRLTR